MEIEQKIKAVRLSYRQQMGERQDDAQLPRPTHLRAALQRKKYFRRNFINMTKAVTYIVVE